MVTNTKVDKDRFAQITTGTHELNLPCDHAPLQVGDTLILEEWDTESASYTGRKIEAVIMAVAAPPRAAETHCIHFEPKDSKYTPTA